MIITKSENILFILTNYFFTDFTTFSIIKRGNFMRVDKIQNTPNNQAFGMSYYLKCSKNINSDYHKYYVTQRQVHYYEQK